MFGNSNRTVIINLEQSVISALAKLAPDASMPVAGKLVASKDVQAKIQAHVDTMTSLTAARAKASQLHDVDESQRTETDAILTCVRNYAAGLFGENSPEFASFGFLPKKVAQRTLESKTDAAEKVRATRVARHTMGKRQKAAIHGVVATAPAAIAPSASPPVTAPVVAPPASPTPIVVPAVNVAPAASPPANVAPVVAPAANSPPAADAGTNGAVPTAALVTGPTH